ncbi:DNA recombination protein RmuC [Patescibacteria group bacterium]|nr:DNA recombination protein RmuC [Patescibacteria group bacterium]
MFTAILLIINSIGIIFLIFLFFKSKKSDNTSQIIKSVEVFFDKNERGLKEEMSLSRKEYADSEKRLREELSNLFKGFGDSLDKRMSEFANTQNKNFEGFSIKLTELIDKNDIKMEKVREVVEKKLDFLQKDNSEKLESIRVTVDEKLHATLEKRFGESFKLVSDRLDLVHKGLGEMQVLANGVGDLKKVLSNVKTRGTWGEAQLGNLIEEIFTPDQYEKNVKTKKTSKDNVEYAIKLPGNEDGKNIWLPIDAKFPLEDYQKLVEAQDLGDTISVEEFGKSLENRIKSEAKDIRDKYIDVPNTTDFGILFVPTESLYAEILRRPGLYELLRKNYKVIITGPTTIQVILNSLQVGFRTLNIQKRSGEVWTVLSTIKINGGNVPPTPLNNSLLGSSKKLYFQALL